MSQFVVRGADAEDAPAIGLAQYDSWVETYDPIVTPDFWKRVTPELCIRTWEQWLADGLQASVGVVDDQIVGHAFTRPARTYSGYEPVRDLEVASVYVLAEHHGSGLGQALLDSIVTSDQPAQLWVALGNDRAIRFYERNGFRADGATDTGESFGGIAAQRMVR